MTKEELEVGKEYWFCSSKKTEPVALKLTNKVQGRKAYRFIPTNGKKAYLLHEQRLSQVFITFKEAMGHVEKHRADTLAGLPRAYAPDGVFLNPPRLDQWTVALGYPRRKKFGRT